MMNELTYEQRKALVEKYPYLAPKNSWTGELSSDYNYDYIHGEYDIPNGWFVLFLLYCKTIRPYLVEANYLDKFYFTQIKEKYGRLCLYDGGKPEKASDFESLYGAFSKQICQCCGKPAHIETRGWIGFFCRSCGKTLRQTVHTQKVYYKRHVTVERYMPDGTSIKSKLYFKDLRKEHNKCLKMNTEELVAYLLGD